MADKEIEVSWQIVAYQDLALTLEVGHSTPRPRLLAREHDKRRFYNHIVEWQVGVDEDNYSYVGKGVGPVEWYAQNPWVKVIQGVFHLVGNPYITGQIYVRDMEALIQLMKTVDVVSGGGTEPAMTSTDRNTVGWFAVKVTNTRITDADVRSDDTLTFLFNNTRIMTDGWKLHEPSSPILVKFYADSVSFLPVTEDAWWTRSLLDLSTTSQEALTFTISSTKDLALCLMRYRGLFDPAIFDIAIFDTISTPLTFLSQSSLDLFIATEEAQVFTTSSTLTLAIVP